MTKVNERKTTMKRRKNTKRKHKELGELSLCRDRLRAGKPGFHSRQGQTFRPALWSTQTPVAWVLGDTASGAKNGGATPQFHLSLSWRGA